MEETKCLFPCTFMEYKVSIFQTMRIFAKMRCTFTHHTYDQNYIFQLTEDPYTITGVEPMTTLVPVFSTNTVEYISEKPAFPFSSLLADCGGVLGLFIGFNFMIVWDWIVWAVKFAFTKKCHSFKRK